MVLQPTAVPVVQRARRIPLSLRGPLQEELRRLERKAIIVKENDPTDWYVPGKHLVLADMLSRSAPASHEDIAGAADDVEVHAVLVLGYLVTGATRQKLVQETARDGYFSTVISNLSSGESLQGELKPFRQSFPS
ncbi:uncharacterized protein [Dermacentor albipictus]|uniref:uncharacterized protein isoform X2 n=1 Tax=Dermacentor albipictus TaxID=60249 RepID=UPI0038FCE5DB